MALLPLSVVVPTASWNFEFVVLEVVGACCFC